MASHIPENRRGWWGGPDLRPRCDRCDKVAFADQAAAERSAEKIRARGENMRAYFNKKCAEWHVGH
jgi:hypothetical protein